MRPPLVIYHANCSDGFTSAWVAHKFLPADTEYRPMRYDDPSPTHADMLDRDIYILDFSFKRGTCLSLNHYASKLVILDHHKTAQAELEGLEFAQFDMNRSGAMMTWDYFAAQNWDKVNSVPWVVSYVQDRDLWRHALPRSREVNAYIATLPHTFETWDELEDNGVVQAISAGVGALAYVQMLVRRAEARGANVLQFGAHRVPVINVTAAVSDVVGALAELQPFAAGWWQNVDGTFSVSLRSNGAKQGVGADVSEIAKQYGGGGHRNAAGFTVASWDGLPWLNDGD